MYMFPLPLVQLNNPQHPYCIQRLRLYNFGTKADGWSRWLQRKHKDGPKLNSTHKRNTQQQRTSLYKAPPFTVSICLTFHALEKSWPNLLVAYLLIVLYSLKFNLNSVLFKFFSSYSRLFSFTAYFYLSLFQTSRLLFTVPLSPHKLIKLIVSFSIHLNCFSYLFKKKIMQHQRFNLLISICYCLFIYGLAY